MNDQKIKELTRLMISNIQKAIQTSQELGEEGGIGPAWEAHMVLLALNMALKENNTEELFKIVDQFVSNTYFGESYGQGCAINYLVSESNFNKAQLN